MPQRLFIGAKLSRSQNKALVRSQEILRSHTRRSSFTKPDNFHLTIRFLGEVEEQTGQQIATALKEIELPRLREYHTRISGYGSFSSREGHLIYAKLDVSSVLLELVSKINAALVAFPIKPQKKRWLAHVTIARRVLWKPEVKNMPPMRSTKHFEGLQGIHLFLSEFTDQGMKYTSLLDIMSDTKEDEEDDEQHRVDGKISLEKERG